jgi:hypothetical protein
MGDNWYAVEQWAHDRITEARAAARSRTLLRELTPPHRGPYALGIGLLRLGGWVLTRHGELPIELSHALANVRAAANRGRSANTR